jgi:hypothetical protein
MTAIFSPQPLHGLAPLINRTKEDVDVAEVYHCRNLYTAADRCRKIFESANTHRTMIAGSISMTYGHL